MLKKYLYAYKYKYDASGDLSLLLETSSENAAYLDSCGRTDKCRYAYDRYSQPYIYIQERKCYTDSKGVYARSYRHNKHSHKPKRRVCVRILFIVAERFPYHLSSDERKQYERYPVIERCYILIKRRAKHKTEKRHKRLKSAEPRACDAHMLQPYISRSQSLTD